MVASAFIPVPLSEPRRVVREHSQHHVEAGDGHRDSGPIVRELSPAESDDRGRRIGGMDQHGLADDGVGGVIAGAEEGDPQQDSPDRSRTAERRNQTQGSTRC